jgi:nicotinamide-nucleotide amidase
VRVELLAVGTELLLGDIVNTNAAWLGRQLAAAGLDVTQAAVVGDNVGRIADAMRAGLDRADALVVCGGLGPTQDDVTRDALAEVAGVPLVRDEVIAQGLSDRYAALGRQMPARNLRQADLPAGAVALPNQAGTAPGVRIELPAGVVYLLPGVPHELHRMFTAAVVPDLLARAGEPAVIVSRTLRTVGLWESAVAERLAALHESLEPAGNPTMAYLAGGGQVRVRITAKAADRSAAEQLIAPVEAEARRLLGIAVYGVDDHTLDRVLHELLADLRSTVATGESLSGGLLGAALTEMPGASATYLGGVVAYATDAKRDLLGVSADLLAEEGPVSARTAAAMALGARQRFAATYGLALTGVAGPTDQDGVPAGTVFAAVAGPDGGDTRALQLPGDRERIRALAVVSALDLLRRHLLRLRGSVGRTG